MSESPLITQLGQQTKEYILSKMTVEENKAYQAMADAHKKAVALHQLTNLALTAFIKQMIRKYNDDQTEILGQKIVDEMENPSVTKN